ncbi:MAG: tetratricopeptide repeat protein [Candidatus Omnitrophica bacterium]|nr:tetratricopeptide repeat protein [Candidatus Omnitrophota bacterium]
MDPLGFFRGGAGRAALALIGVGLAIHLYERILLDPYLHGLKTVALILDAATEVKEAESALSLADQLLVEAMGRQEIDPRAVSSLQYVQGVLAAGQGERSVADAQVMLDALVGERAAFRPRLLATFDSIVVAAESGFRGMVLLPRQLLRQDPSRVVGSARFRQAAQLERQGLLAEAADLYEQLLKVYPNDPGRSILRLRLGFLFHRTRALDRAGSFYVQALRDAQDLRLVEVTRQMLQWLDRLRWKEARAVKLEKLLLTVGPGPERQQVAFEYASFLIQLYQMDKAAQIFREGAMADPRGELELPCLFKEAWCLKRMGRFEEALSLFEQVVRKDPAGPWGTASNLQLADLYKAEGDYAGSIRIYEQVVAESKEEVLVAAALAQAGATSLYDLKDRRKAESYFQETAARFPASIFSTVGKQLEESQGAKVAPARFTSLPSVVGSLALGSPLMNWLEDSLPVFVELFAGRAIRYMASMAQREVTQKLTEEEFRKMLSRRLNERFPGQVSEISAKIRPDGMTVSLTVSLGMAAFPLSWKVGVQVVEERPHVVVQELKAAGLSVPEEIRGVLEARVNQAVDRLQWPLKVKRCELKEGYAWVSVESAE